MGGIEVVEILGGLVVQGLAHISQNQRESLFLHERGSLFSGGRGFHHSQDAGVDDLHHA